MTTPDLRDDWPSELRRPAPDEQATSDGAARIAATRPIVPLTAGRCDCGVRDALLAEVERLTAERDNLAERLDWQKHKRGQVEADRDALMAAGNALHVAAEMYRQWDEQDRLKQALGSQLSYDPAPYENLVTALDGWRALVPVGGAADDTTP